eukprot:TRINITY_DN11216_c0_g2_i1.p1 TRINITY_DN11216_c0_g2~~TRINITY_DN11216_c0_g2_i1.p1  ORF type:complete len:199 (+),score=27.37 TRINITY_DN11216_c0_g2_i1:50-646(+)
MNPDDEMMGTESALNPMVGMNPWEAPPQMPSQMPSKMPPLVPGDGPVHPSLLERMDRARAVPPTARSRATDPLNEGEPSGEARFKRPCVFHSLGKCRWGSNCKYSHEPPHLMVNLTANYQPKTPYEAMIKSLTDGSAAALTEEGTRTDDYEIIVDLMKLFRLQGKLRVALARQHERDAAVGRTSQPFLSRHDHPSHPQ